MTRIEHTKHTHEEVKRENFQVKMFRARRIYRWILPDFYRRERTFLNYFFKKSEKGEASLNSFHESNITKPKQGKDTPKMNTISQHPWCTQIKKCSTKYLQSEYRHTSKDIIHHNLLGFIQKTQIFSTYVCNKPQNGLKNKNHTIISKNAEKTCDKIHHAFTIKV